MATRADDDFLTDPNSFSRFFNSPGGQGRRTSPGGQPGFVSQSGSLGDMSPFARFWRRTPKNLINFNTGSVGLNAQRGFSGIGSGTFSDGEGDITLDQVGKAGVNDLERQQAAGNRQFGRNQEQIEGFDEFLGGIGKGIKDTAQMGIQELSALAGQSKNLATRQREDFEKNAGKPMEVFDKWAQGANERLDKADADVEGAYLRGDEAVAGFQKTMDEYEDRTAQDASIAAAAIRRDSQAAMQQASAGVNPDGTLMDPAQRADMIASIRRGTAEQVQSAITPIFSRFNEVKAQLGEALAGIRMNNAGLHLEGAKTRQQSAALGAEIGKAGAEIGLETNAQRLQSQQLELENFKLQSALTEAMAEMRNAAQLQSVQLEMEGRINLAEMVRNNPETVVSVFNMMMAMYSLQQGAKAEQEAGNPPQGGQGFQLPEGTGGGLYQSAGGFKQGPGRNEEQQQNRADMLARRKARDTAAGEANRERYRNQRTKARGPDPYYGSTGQGGSNRPR